MPDELHCTFRLIPMLQCINIEMQKNIKKGQYKIGRCVILNGNNIAMKKFQYITAPILSQRMGEVYSVLQSM